MKRNYMNYVTKYKNIGKVIVLFTIIFSITMLVNNKATHVQAYDVTGFYQYESNATGITITKYTGGEITVTIPSKIGGKNVTEIGFQAFSDKDIMESVIIPKTVKSIRNGAFYDCDSLVEMTIPNSVTNIESSDWHGEQTFGFCDSLTKVIIGDNVAAINLECFKECPKLHSVTIGKSVATIAKGAFYNCDSLTNIEIPKSVKSIGISCFSDCTNLKSVTLADGLEVIDHGAFYHCSSLKEVIIPNSVTTINSTDWHGEQTFGLCENLTKVVIGDNVTAINMECFAECTKLQEVTIGKRVASIEKNAFYNCDSLVNIEIPNSVKSIGSSCFSDCNNLKSVKLSYGLDVINNGAFYNCSSLEEVIIPNSVTTLNSTDWHGEETFGKCNSLMKLQIPNSVTTIGKDLVAECDYITIYGYSNSAAAKYANDNSIPFQELTSIPADKLEFNNSEVLMMVGENVKLNYTIKPENTTDAIVWKTSDENIATVNNIGVVTAKATGSVSIIAATTSGIKKSMTVIVEEAPKSISFKVASKTIAVDQTFTQKALIDAGGRTDVSITYTSSNTDIATVSNKGKVTAKKTGTVTITARIFNGLTATYQVTIKKAPASISIKPANITLKVNQSYKLKVSIPSGSYTSKYIFTSSNTKVVTINKNGVLVARMKGTAKITVTTHNGKKAYCILTVK